MSAIPGQEQRSTVLFRAYLLGCFSLQRRTTPEGAAAVYEEVPAEHWGKRRQAMRLLMVLLARPGRRASKDFLTELFWPETEPEQAAVYLIQNVAKLRKVLRLVEGGESLLIDERAGYRLASQQLLWVDADAAEALMQQASAQHAQALPLVQQAVTLLQRGTLLQEEEGTWVLGRRGRLEDLRKKSQIRLAQMLAQQDRLDEAESTLYTLLEEDPTDEEVLCYLMELLHQQGRTQQALRVYERCCEVFATEGLEPTEATKNLAVQLATSNKRMYTSDSLTSPASLIDEQNRTASLLPLANQLIEVDRELGEDKFSGKLSPALLGRDALHLFVPFSPLPSHVTNQVSFDQETLKAYQSLLPAYWEAYYASSRATTLDEIEVIIQDLGRMIVYGNAHQQTEIQELLCQYHQFALDLARDQGNFGRALYHAHFTLLLATQTGNNELLAACLYRRGLTYFDMGNLPAAANDLRDALPFARLARPQLQGMVIMEAARFQAHLEPDEREKVLQIDQLLDQTQRLVENGPLEDDAGHVKLDKGRYSLGRAATLLALKRSTTARGELDEAARLVKQEHRRRRAYITILRARTYFVEGDFDYATDLALDAATSCLAIQSKSNLADLSRFYASLTQTSFKYAPTTVQLGVLLRAQK